MQRQRHRETAGHRCLMVVNACRTMKSLSSRKRLGTKKSKTKLFAVRQKDGKNLSNEVVATTYCGNFRCRETLKTGRDEGKYYSIHRWRRRKVRKS